MNKFKVVILAAGQGKRMGRTDLPKVLIPLKGKPLIKYLLEAVEKSMVCDRPVIVVGKMAEKVKEALGPAYTYVLQAEQLGTGHAVMTTQGANMYENGQTYTYSSRPEQLGTGHDVKVTESNLRGKAEDIMVLNGDHPLVSSETIKDLAHGHFKEGKVLTMGTVTAVDFEGWRQSFYDFGRIIRDQYNKVIKIVEKKDASEEELKVREVNLNYFCFKADWLWQNLDKLQNNNVQGEYYLTDLVGLAVGQGEEIATIEIDPKAGLGINTEEQLKEIEKLL